MTLRESILSILKIQNYSTFKYFDTIYILIFFSRFKYKLQNTHK